MASHRNETGNVFDYSSTHSLALCVSEDFVMDTGMAKIFKSKYGMVQFLKNQKKVVGEVAYVCLTSGETSQYIYYLVSKKLHSEKTTIDNLVQCLKALNELITIKNIDCKQIAMSSVVDELQWTQVWEAVEKNITACNITLCKRPEATHDQDRKRKLSEERDNLSAIKRGSSNRRGRGRPFKRRGGNQHRGCFQRGGFATRGARRPFRQRGNHRGQSFLSQHTTGDCYIVNIYNN